MKIAIVGVGLIGSKLVELLRSQGHEVAAMSRSTGVDAVTGSGLRAALAGVEVVVDVLNSPSFETEAVLAFFQASSRNLLAEEKTAGVKHHVALSVVGADRIPDSGYMRAKAAQEALIRNAGMPYTILRATQFFEFVGAIAESGVVDGVPRLPPAMMQPVAAEDVVAALADIAVSAPANGIIELAGPERIRMDEMIRRFFGMKGDPRTVTTDPQALYFGAAVDDASLVPVGKARLGATRFKDWFVR